MTKIQNEQVSSFFQVFSESISKTLIKNLDSDVCKTIQLTMKSSSTVKNAEDLKKSNAIYKLDYAIGNRQGPLIILIPEELIAAISDILTGGTGQDSYKGSLSEIETNSISKILEKVFKNAESDFKKLYEHDFAFSANPILRLKETPEYEINTEEAFFDFLISTNLSLNEGEDYKIDILTNSTVLNGLMNDLGLIKVATAGKKLDLSALDVTRLSDVKINITAELGKTRVPIKVALELVRGSLIELDTLNDSDIKVFANGIEFAHAQVVAVEENFGLKITKIISAEERLETL